ncbi:MAG: septum formation initiator family protein, partial [Candidatus Saccharimonadales bacterium]
MKNTFEKYSQRFLTIVQRFSDPRFAGQVVFVVIILLVSWSGIKSIQSNYSLQQQISELRQRNSLQQLQNDNLKLQNDYYNSSQYLELSARQNFPLAAPGEIEIIVPTTIAAKYASGLPDSTAKQTVTDATPIVPPSNFQSW